MTTMCTVHGLGACLDVFDQFCGYKVQWNATDSKRDSANQEYFLASLPLLKTTLLRLPVIAAAGMTVESVRRQLEDQHVYDFGLPDSVNGVLLASRLENRVTWRFAADDFTYRGLPYSRHIHTNLYDTSLGKMLVIKGENENVHLLPYQGKIRHELQLYHMAMEALKSVGRGTEVENAFVPMINAQNIKQETTWMEGMYADQFRIQWARSAGKLTMDSLGTIDRVDTTAAVSMSVTIEKYIVEGPFLRFITRHDVEGPFGIWHLTEEHIADPNR